MYMYTCIHTFYSARKLTTHIPTAVLLKWNSIPSSSPAIIPVPNSGTISPFVNGIISRMSSQGGSPSSMCDSTANHPRRIVVETANVAVEEGGTTTFDTVYPFFTPGVDRYAKLLANLRMKERTKALKDSSCDSKHHRSKSSSRKTGNRRVRSPPGTKQKRSHSVGRSFKCRNRGTPKAFTGNQPEKDLPEELCSSTGMGIWARASASAGDVGMAKKPPQQLLLKTFSIPVKKVSAAGGRKNTFIN